MQNILTQAEAQMALSQIPKNQSCIISTRDFDGQGAVDYSVQQRVLFRTGYLSDCISNQLINSSTSVALGVTNFKDNRLSSNQFFVVKGVRITWATQTGVQPTSGGNVNAALAAANFVSSVPVNALNGEFFLSQGKTGIQISVSTLTKYDHGNTKIDFFATNPFLIRPEVDFEVKLVPATPAVADQAYKLELYGDLYTRYQSGN